MSRHPSTDASGKPFDATIVQAVWEKADVSHAHRPLRIDAFGSVIWREAYENTNSKFGWEIDHIRPVARGGGDELENLQALQWENNRRKGDTFANGEQASLHSVLSEGLTVAS
jgi:5-methylcytosine-specific restriction endonuclease McrA